MVHDTAFEQRIEQRFKNISNRFRTIDNLIKAGEIRTHGDVLTADKEVLLKTIYGDASTVTIGKFGLIGGQVTDHIHPEVAQYIICVKGSFNIQTSKWSRVIYPADCAAIPKSILHSVTALENSSELIAVCVPEDGAYLKSMGEIK